MSEVLIFDILQKIVRRPGEIRLAGLALGVLKWMCSKWKCYGCMFGLRRLSLPLPVLTNDYLTGSLPVLLGVAC